MRTITYISIALIIISLFYLPAQTTKEKYYEVNGQTMGTFYHIKIRQENESHNIRAIKQKIEDELKSINNQMSMFVEESEINIINQAPIETKIKLSTPLSFLLQNAKQIYHETEKAFDPTIKPLTDLWGFGQRQIKDIPSDKEIKQAKQHIGLDKISITKDGTYLIKKANVTFDLSAIAKGYGVDRLTELLKKEGFNNFIIEIGGEIKTRGKRDEKGNDWNIALTIPIKTLHPQAYILNLKDEAVATSGNYRNYYEKNGKKYGHTLSPQTGYPVETDILSATVINPSGMKADAYATSLMVLGWKKGKMLAEKLNLAVILQRINKEKEFELYISPSARKNIKEQ